MPASPIVNVHGQKIGPALPNWESPPLPGRTTLKGRTCRLEPLEPGHADALFTATQLDTQGKSWTYLPYGPFATQDEYRTWIAAKAKSTDPLFYAILEATSGQPVGVASYLRLDPSNGVIEVGHLYFSPVLQHTTVATEAMYLMMRHAFDLGYRRYEWKCDALNEPSRRAALRLGFTFEGIFRQAVIVKGRNRDTAWYSILDGEWPQFKRSFETWLAPENFDDLGQQKTRLSVRAAQGRDT
ncbi:MAG TPA: GNAT family protein [Verrucomicrobium sp.]|nr:GNAT family protein [Verrucomicrobium sp.]